MEVKCTHKCSAVWDLTHFCSGMEWQCFFNGWSMVRIGWTRWKLGFLSTQTCVVDWCGICKWLGSEICLLASSWNDRVFLIGWHDWLVPTLNLCRLNRCFCFHTIDRLMRCLIAFALVSLFMMPRFSMMEWISRPHGTFCHVQVCSCCPGWGAVRFLLSSTLSVKDRHA